MYGRTLGVSVPDFPSPSDAAAWLQDNLDQFRALGPEMLDMIHTATLVKVRAREQGRIERANEAAELADRLLSLKRRYDDVRERLERIVDRVPGLAGIPVPVAIAGAVISVAAAAAYIVQKVGVERRRLDLIAEGVLEPGEGEGGGPLDRISDTAMWAALGVGLVTLGPVVADALRR